MICPFLRLVRPVMLLAIALAVVPMSAQELPRRWLRVRSAELPGRTVLLGELRRGTTGLLSGVDPVADGLWLPLPVGVDAGTLRFEPPLVETPRVDVVALPPELSGSWALVPLPLSAWGVDALDGVASFRISRGQRGRLRASSMREERERPSNCPPLRTKPPAIRFPARVADFEAGPLEPLGNRFGFFAGRGGTASGSRVRDGGTTRLLVTAKLDAPKSYGGFWLQLAPAAWLDDPQAGADAGGLAAIAVRGRGEPRGVVKLSDVKTSENDRSVVLGALDGEPDRDGSWVRVLPIPSGKLDLSRLRSLVIDLTPDGGGSVEIEEIVFLGEGDEPPPPNVPEASAVEPGPVRAGLWVWNTKQLFEPGSEWRLRLLKTIDRWKLTEVYLQLPHADGDSSLGDWNDEARGRAMAALVEELHRAKVRVHALDGAAWLALPEARGELLALVESVRDYNEKNTAAARFDAVHLDIEPYLLPGFGGRLRGELLSSLVEGLTRAKTTLRGIPLWLDIPFWYDSREATTVETGPRAGCARQDLLRALFGVADGIGVMSYRTRADGADGLTATALGELELGRELGKPVRLGIETIDLPLEEGWDVRLEGGAARAGEAAIVLPSGDERHVWFSLSATEDDLRWLGERERRAILAEPGDVAPPSKITFFGRSAQEIRAVVDEALELALRAGLPADGVAYHELRTLP